MEKLSKPEDDDADFGSMIDDEDSIGEKSEKQGKDEKVVTAKMALDVK